MSYFAEHYSALKYPFECDDSPGLRSSQLGAIHAIASYFSLRKRNAGMIVMPTGSGKTAVLMMAPFLTMAQKVLIVTPSKLVRSQIYDDYSALKTLKKAKVFDTQETAPQVFEMDHLLSDDMRDTIEQSDVVVATSQCALSLSEDTISTTFDLILIDEAHHSAAPTWRQILINMHNAKRYLFTATPFRMDNKEISGDVIYYYPLSMAYSDGIFGDIRYIPIRLGPNKDTLIAKEAERVLLNDRNLGLNHFLMVRTDGKDKAKQLQNLYSECTTLKLQRIDSSMTHRTIRLCIAALKSMKIDGIICVDMLGEGFDFPNLKIAAIHAPHKSLASTLQFIGRFARTNADNIGAAKFIAMNDDELVIENYKL